MTSASPEVKRALKAVQGRVRQRRGRDGSASAAVQGPPVDDLLKAAVAAITADVRFEHLAPAGDLVREFADSCEADRRSDHVQAFMDSHGQDARDEVCFFGVEHLAVEEPVEVAGTRLLPLEHPDIPDNPILKADPLMASVLAVPVTGTNKVLMEVRARRAAEHALRIVRIGMRQQSLGVHARQLRFRLATSYAFDAGSGGGQMHHDRALPVTLPASIATSILAVPVAGLPLDPAKEIEKKALLAIEWLDRAAFMPDPLVATLFRFFALEALLGKQTDKLKNGPLALRQMTLSAIVHGYWFHPDDTFLQYEEVRSYAVHGESAPEVTELQAAEFAHVVRETLDQYLTVAKANGFTRRSHLRDHLDNHPRRQEQIAWIRDHGSPKLNKYLDAITAAPDSCGEPAGAEDRQDPGLLPLAGEPPPTRSVMDGADQEADVAVVDAGDGVAEVDGGLAGEAGGEP